MNFLSLCVTWIYWKYLESIMCIAQKQFNLLHLLWNHNKANIKKAQPVTCSSWITRPFAETLRMVWGCIPLTWSSLVSTWNAGRNGMLTYVELTSYWPTASSTMTRNWSTPVRLEMTRVFSEDATDSITHWYSPYNSQSTISKTYNFSLLTIYGSDTALLHPVTYNAFVVTAHYFTLHYVVPRHVQQKYYSYKFQPNFRTVILHQAVCPETDFRKTVGTELLQTRCLLFETKVQVARKNDIG